MSYSDIVATLSLVIACAAFFLPFWRDNNLKQKEKRKYLLEAFTQSTWSNEGDIFSRPKAHYTVEFNKSEGLSNVHGVMYINVNERSYEFYGVISAKGVLSTTLRMPLGKFGANIAKVKFSYSEDDGEINYEFEGYIDNKHMAEANNVFDTKQKLWRVPAPV